MSDAHIEPSFVFSGIARSTNRLLSDHWPILGTVDCERSAKEIKSSTGSTHPYAFDTDWRDATRRHMSFANRHA